MVDILIASYNGEKYIRAQLLSLLYQSYRDIRIIVHDDGSTDRTVEIVREIAKIDKRVLLIEDGITLGSAGRNFMHLLKFSQADVVMFCDQDDIWFDNKVAKMLEVFTKIENKSPRVLFSDLYAWHPDMGITGLTMTERPTNLKGLLFHNGGLHGCASMFNASMRSLMLKWRGDVSMHDHILSLLGVTFGKISYMVEPLMLYRRHPEAVTASCFLKANAWNCFYSKRKIPVAEARHYNAVARFLEVYENELSSADKEIIRHYLKMKNQSLLGRIISVIRYRFRIHNSVLMLLIKLMIRPYYGELSFNRCLSAGGGLSLDLEGNFVATNREFKVAA